MQGQGFLGKPNHSPVSFGLAFTITGAGLAALLLISPYVREAITPTIIEGVNIPIEKLINPPPPPPKPTHERRIVNQQTSQTPPVAPPNGSTDVTGTATGELVTGTGGGDIFKPGPIDIPEVPPVANPVLTDARYDMRFAASQQPPYPAAKQREEIEGSVTVRVKIGTDGRVLAVESVRATDEAFFISTRDWALRKWRFKPATRDGVAIESWRTMSVKFTMNN